MALGIQNLEKNITLQECCDKLSFIVGNWNNLHLPKRIVNSDKYVLHTIRIHKQTHEVNTSFDICHQTYLVICIVMDSRITISILHDIMGYINSTLWPRLRDEL